VKQRLCNLMLILLGVVATVAALASPAWSGTGAIAQFVPTLFESKDKHVGSVATKISGFRDVPPLSRTPYRAR